VSRHYIRINPADIHQCTDEDPNCGTLFLANQAPGTQYEFPAKEIVDAGFLELVRYGIRRADDPTIQDSIRVVDAVLKVETPYGPSWRRYNHDGYGQRDDGKAYKGWGTGRPWPLLTGERGHYEIAAGRDPVPYLRALENFAQGVGLIPEQIWDAPDLPSRHFRFGRSTDAAVPLVWAHSEYVTLHRSVADGRVFDLVEPVHQRYVRRQGKCKAIEVWKFNRQVQQMVEAGTILRIQANSTFLLHWTKDDWRCSTDTPSRSTALGIDYADIVVPDGAVSLQFTFLWVDEDRWETNNYKVQVKACP
jgi:glucoamylase